MLVEERGETWVDGGHFRNAWTVRSDWLERPSAPRTHLTMEMVLFRAGSSLWLWRAGADADDGRGSSR
jgi:hypothetical protein